jgi:hypothetical protein
MLLDPDLSAFGFLSSLSRLATVERILLRGLSRSDLDLDSDSGLDLGLDLGLDSEILQLMSSRVGRFFFRFENV